MSYETNYTNSNEKRMHFYNLKSAKLCIKTPLAFPQLPSECLQMPLFDWYLFRFDRTNIQVQSLSAMSREAR